LVSERQLENWRDKLLEFSNTVAVFLLILYWFLKNS
jgi:hypothetical protein